MAAATLKSLNLRFGLLTCKMGIAAQQRKDGITRAIANNQV